MVRTGRSIVRVFVVGALGLVLGFGGGLARVRSDSDLEDRVAANEAGTIADLIAVLSAQASYRAVNAGWFDGQLGCLARPADCIPQYPANGPVFLEAELASLQPRRGYSRSFAPGPRPPLAPGMAVSPSSVSDYAYLARPIEHGPTGTRSFCADSRGTLCFRPDGGAIQAPRGICPIGAGPTDCLALPATQTPTAGARVPQPAQAPRAWRWATEREWVVHEVVRALVSWSGLATGSDPSQTRIEVHRRDTRLEGSDEFDVTIGRGTQTQVLIVRPTSHVWAPDGYVALAGRLLESRVSPQSALHVGEVDSLILNSDAAAFRRADAALFGELKVRPLDAGLHEQAALLWAAQGLRETDGTFGDDRPFLNGLSAHLALAAAIRGARPPGPHGVLATATLNALVFRQLDAMVALSHLDASAPALASFAAALRVRVTRNPAAGEAHPRSRLEQLETLRALYRGRSCRAAVEQARAWGLGPAAEWIRGTASCGFSEDRDFLMGRYLELQTADAARAIDIPAETAATPDLADVLRRLATASATNTHQAARPTEVVPVHVRADAGVRHVLSAILASVGELRGLAQPRAIRELAVATEAFTEGLPQRPLLEMAFEDGGARSERAPSRQSCDHLARVIADRPDLIPPDWWSRGQGCTSQNLLKSVAPRQWHETSFVPGTARQVSGPWPLGVAVSPATLLEARRLAPWVPAYAQYWLHATYGGEAPPKAVLEAYGKLLEYDTWAMRAAFSDLHGDDGSTEALAERICERDVELCAQYAGPVAWAGRQAAAEKLWRRALEGSHDPIALSNSMDLYVNELLDRGDTGEALRIAKRVGDVYSEQGLFTLGMAHERLEEFDQASRVYATITERYDDKFEENAFYVRYEQRHTDTRFADERRRALAELFPNGLRRQSLDEVKKSGSRGGAPFGSDLDERWRRIGARPGDLLVAFGGYAVEDESQLRTLLTFTDDPEVSVIVVRRDAGPIGLSGAFPRLKYGPVAGRKARLGRGQRLLDLS
jgi:hypothetical protein